MCIASERVIAKIHIFLILDGIQDEGKVRQKIFYFLTRSKTRKISTFFSLCCVSRFRLQKVSSYRFPQIKKTSFFVNTRRRHRYCRLMTTTFIRLENLFLHFSHSFYIVNSLRAQKGIVQCNQITFTPLIHLTDQARES